MVKLRVPIWRHALIVAPFLLCSPSDARAQFTVFLGGTSGLPSLANPQATNVFRTVPGTGFYLHFNATDPLFASSLRSIAKVFAGKQVVAEVSLGGGFTPQFWSTSWRKNVTVYGFSPHVAVVNVDIASPEAAASVTAATLQQFKDFAEAGRAQGIEMFAPVITPNSSAGPGPDADARTLAIMHPWPDPWWDRLRNLAQIGGGIAFDAPPAFFLRGLPDQTQIKAYQTFIITGLHWAAEHHIPSTYIVSPYFDGATFGGDSETVYRLLRDADALPQTWVVENYNLCGEPYPRECSSADAAFLAPVGQEDKPNTEASVALWFASRAADKRRIE